MKTIVVMLLTLMVSAIPQAGAKEAKCGPIDADWWQQADSPVHESKTLSRDVRVAQGQDDFMIHEPSLKYQNNEDDDEDDDEDGNGKDGDGGPDRLWDAVSLG